MGMRFYHISTCLKKAPNNLKGKSKSSQEWLTRQLKDTYVKRAHECNYRARSAFKLIEIDDKVKILKPGQTVVECGAAPGAWTQVIVQKINSDGHVPRKRIGTIIGIDLLPIVPLNGAIFLGGHDFTSSDTIEKVRTILLERKANGNDGKLMVTSTVELDISSKNESVSDDFTDVSKSICNGKQKLAIDVVLSDMAPNATGQRYTDHPRIIKLVEKALEFALENGNTGGHFLAKIWDGNETQRLESSISKYYEKVSRHKPPSSRNDSSELFILGKHKK